MFYSYRKPIYISLIILLMAFCFILGKSMNSSKNIIVNSNEKILENEKDNTDMSDITKNLEDDNAEILATQAPEEKIIEQTKEPELKGHINYNSNIEIKGDKYKYICKVSNAAMADRTKANFSISHIENKDIVNVNVIAKDQLNSPLKINIVKKDAKKIDYVIIIDKNTEIAVLNITPITKDVENLIKTKKRKLEEFPYGTASLSIKMLIKETIEKLEG